MFVSWFFLLYFSPKLSFPSSKQTRGNWMIYEENRCKLGDFDGDCKWNAPMGTWKLFPVLLFFQSFSIHCYHPPPNLFVNYCWFFAIWFLFNLSVFFQSTKLLHRWARWGNINLSMLRKFFPSAWLSFSSFTSSFPSSCRCMSHAESDGTISKLRGLGRSGNMGRPKYREESWGQNRMGKKQNSIDKYSRTSDHPRFYGLQIFSLSFSPPSLSSPWSLLLLLG